MNSRAFAASPTMQSVLPLLGLCPILAVSDSVANALGLGIVAILAVTLSFFIASLIGKRLAGELRWVVAVLLLATAVGCATLLMDAWLHELNRALGLFLPLLIANFVVQMRADECSHHTPLRAIVLGVRTGGTIALALLALGIAREFVGRGSILHDAGLMFGGWARVLDTQLFRADMGFLLATLPPGAFISFGLLLAARNWAKARLSER
ncbi:MAG TPA: Rnf-Nqr domain containing protein [Steroidobacteraceae bacterium]|jgi:electron transport complex protein RnfE